MGEILISWILGLLVLAIAWGVTDRIVVPLKTLARSLRTRERSKRMEIVVASLFALAVLSIIVPAADINIGEGAGLPALLIWAGGLWLIPFRFDAVEHYWISSLAIAVALVFFWVRKTPSSTRTDASTDILVRQEQDTSARLTGLGFLFWIFLIGLTVAAIARYTSTWNAVALNS